MTNWEGGYKLTGSPRTVQSRLRMLCNILGENAAWILLDVMDAHDCFFKNLDIASAFDLLSG